MPLAALTIPDNVVEKLDRGRHRFPLEMLGGSAVAAAPGRPFLLVDGRGNVLATAIADPENGLLRVVSWEEERAIDDRFFQARIARALALRRVLGFGGGSDAYRLVNSAGDGLSGFTVDIYGTYAVVCVEARGWLPLARVCAEVARGLLALDGVVIKVRTKKSAEGGRERDETIGATPPEKLVVEECGIPFEVHLTGALNVGLFTDMREHRRGLCRFARGQRVLNTFSYSGALSVAAALAGAATVTSVDLARGVLEWSKANFALSRLDPLDARFRFVASDVGRFLAEEEKAGTRFDVIILDPPTVSAAHPSRWSLKNDYPDLIAAASRLLPDDGGVLWVSANTRRGPDLTDGIAVGMERAGRRASILEIGGLPPDYPTVLGDGDARYLRVYILAVR